ncbi:sensor histidine kinase [Cystobacter fuscus]|uniref:sensor histidine kinase n=1 Tax=Cystobacter fuscus TaxID=43 RepID=UPI002B2E433C|nr:sensor histidine kinase [Cystobacter fuscus]
MSPLRQPERSAEALLEKYRNLLRKHEDLVHRLEARNADHISTWKLSTWALETSASGLALVRGGVFHVSNRRWLALAQTPGRWCRLGEEGEGPPHVLRDVALAEARLTLGETGPHVSRYRLEDGERFLELRTDLITAAPHGAQVRVLIQALDITEQVRSEQELAQARAALAEQEHLRGLGELAAGIVHDLNNTLNAMRLRLELIQRDAEFAERQRGNLDALVRIVSDAATRLQHLQGFARQTPEPRPSEQVQLARVVHEAVEIARSDIEHRAAREGLSLRLEVEVPSLPLVNGSASDLRYVIINLLLNARDAMPRGGTIRVHGQACSAHVVLTVADEGTGIPPEHLRAIFRPFFTTKGSKGTGLGLSMAYGVVSRAGGTITADNRPGGGAVFTLTFPRLDPEKAEAPRRRAPGKKRAPARRPSRRR